MLWTVLVRCKNAHCDIPGNPIPLPYSIPADTNVSPPALLKDIFPAYVVCRDCGRWYVYSVEDAEWGAFPSPRQVEDPNAAASWTVEMKCGYSHCGVLTKWHIRDTTGLAGAEIVKLVTYRLDEGEVIDPETGSGPADKEK